LLTASPGYARGFTRRRAAAGDDDGLGAGTVASAISADGELVGIE
jgi:hypothetical protein